MRALSLLLAGIALAGCLEFDKRLGECVDAGKCLKGDGGSIDGGGSSLVGATSIDFGAVAVGDLPTRDYSFSNASGMATGPISVFASDGGVFAITGVGCGNIPLNPTAECVVTVRASPSQLGTLTGSLVIDGGAGAGLSVALSVQGIAPLTVGPSPVDFGNVQTGRQAVRTVTVTNFSRQAAALDPMVTGGDFFLVSDGGTCGASLPGTNSCTLGVGFAPGSEGMQEGTLNVTSTVSAALTGIGRAPGALEFEQSDLDFGVVDAGATFTQTLTLTNNGMTSSGPIAFSIPNGSGLFSVDAGSCLSGLASGAMCPLSVTFRPQGAGDEQAALEASYGSDLSILQLTGTGRLEWTLTVISDGGVITFDDPAGVTCPGACTQRYEETSSPRSIHLSEMANAGMAITGWTGCQPASDGCDVIMDANRVVTAHFGPLIPRLFLRGGTGGVLQVDPMGTSCGQDCFEYSPGAIVTVNALPLGGYVFGGFDDDCSGAECQLVMNGSHSVSATFNGPHNFVFVTSPVPSTFLAGGIDAFCATEASNAGLPNQDWRAWVSRGDAGIRDEAAIANARGWVRVDGRPFADQLPVAAAGTVLYPPLLTATGMPATSPVWTGTSSSGTLANDCGDWVVTVSSVTGTVGSPWGGTWRWTDDGTRGCGSDAGLICLGTTNSNTLSIPPAPSNSRMIFVTAQQYAISRAVMANAHCQSEASAASLSGTWTAVLAQGTVPGALDLPNTQQPLYRPDGVLIAERAWDLRDGGIPLAPIEVTAAGNHVDGRVWTGSSGVTQPAAGTNCDDWMTNAATSSAIFGESAMADGRWWAGGNGTFINCNATARLYCVR